MQEESAHSLLRSSGDRAVQVGRVLVSEDGIIKPFIHDIHYWGFLGKRAWKVVYKWLFIGDVDYSGLLGDRACFSQQDSFTWKMVLKWPSIGDTEKDVVHSLCRSIGRQELFMSRVVLRRWAQNGHSLVIMGNKHCMFIIHVSQEMELFMSLWWSWKDLFGTGSAFGGFGFHEKRDYCKISQKHIFLKKRNLKCIETLWCDDRNDSSCWEGSF